MERTQHSGTTASSKGAMHPPHELWFVKIYDRHLICFCARLQLRSIVSLVPFPPIPDLERYCSDNGIELKWEQASEPLAFLKAVEMCLT